MPVNASPGLELVTAMRSAIINGQLLPGQRLVESELADTFQATRAAVRNALLVLEGEGLVEREFNRGARVRAITLPQAIEIIEARAVLDGLCAAKAAERATSEERRLLTELGAQMKTLVDADDIMTYSRLAQQLHLRIREYARHHTMSELLDRLHYQSIRHRFSIALVPGRPKVEAQEHIEIIRAVSIGAADEAEQLMRTHLLSLIGVLRELADHHAAGAGLM
jgi:DNA-binding GntR family transcriptional regulator